MEEGERCGGEVLEVEGEGGEWRRGRCNGTVLWKV